MNNLDILKSPRPKILNMLDAGRFEHLTPP